MKDRVEDAYLWLIRERQRLTCFMTLFPISLIMAVDFKIVFLILFTEEHLAGGVQAVLLQVPINLELRVLCLHLLLVPGHGVALLQSYMLFLVQVMKLES
jgi:hypothetical protein